MVTIGMVRRCSILLLQVSYVRSDFYGTPYPDIAEWKTQSSESNTFLFVGFSGENVQPSYLEWVTCGLFVPKISNQRMSPNEKSNDRLRHVPTCSLITSHGFSPAIRMHFRLPRSAMLCDYVDACTYLPPAGDIGIEESEEGSPRWPRQKSTYCA